MTSQIGMTSVMPEARNCAIHGGAHGALALMAQIFGDLEEAGYVSRAREGRRNRYDVRHDLPLRHPIERHRPVGALVKLILSK